MRFPSKGLIFVALSVSVTLGELEANSKSGISTFVADIIKQLFSTGEHGELKHILQTTGKSSAEICSVLLNKKCTPQTSWEVAIEKHKELSHGAKQHCSKKVIRQILHISDTHVDFDYVEGSVVDCIEPMCCQATSTPQYSSTNYAGKYGSLEKCDLPPETLESMFKFISQNFSEISMIIFTGDLIPHNYWKHSKNSVVQDFNKFIDLKNTYLPNIPMYLALGNHEGIPLNNFATVEVNGEYNSRWLYKELVLSTTPFLTHSNANKTIIQYAEHKLFRGGYYVHRKAIKGLRIISLNMNYCYTINLWLFYKHADPFDQLKWLVEELADAEKYSEKVYILGHIPPGFHQCFYVWSENYNKIIQRYWNVIAGQFFGHTHSDEFEIFYCDKEKPINVAFIAPSVTTYEVGQPAFRVYDINNNHEIVDAHTYYFDLEAANADKTDKPEDYWYYGYSMRSSYDMSDLTPQEFDRLVTRMQTNSTLFNNFWQHFHKNLPALETWNESNRENLLNNLKTTHSMNAKSVEVLQTFYTRF